MTKKESIKFNRLVASAPSGSVFTNNWLERHGISSKLAWWYVRSGLLERVGIKLYKRSGDITTWVGIASALQTQMSLPLHVGGLTALRLLDQSSEKMLRVMLFADLETRVPSWLCDKRWCCVFEMYRTSLFGNHNSMLGMTELDREGMSLRVSCYERAVMETLYLSPKYQTLFGVSLEMEEIRKLRPEMVQLLLENCNSIKVKRFFLYFAERFWPTLVPQLEIKKINLGQGKRAIGRGGMYRYHPKYMLSLPEKIDE